MARSPASNGVVGVWSSRKKNIIRKATPSMGTISTVKSHHGQQQGRAQLTVYIETPTPGGVLGHKATDDGPNDA